MMTRIVAATNNPGKLRELRDILAGYGVEVLSLSEAGVSANPDENGRSFAKNALIKARAVVCKYPVLADDSGLCVNALGGRPGIHTSRYAGADAPAGVKMTKLLAELDAKNGDDRRAHFYCAATIVFPDKAVYSAGGICRGSIARERRGDGGFGYDPIFLLPDGRCIAAIDEDEKNRLSHRGRAIANLIKKLSKDGRI